LRTLEITATEPQAAFYSLDCMYPLFVGGYGSGKSEALVNRAILDSFAGPEAIIAIYAPTYDLLNLILWPRVQKKLTEFGIEFVANKVEKTIVTKGGQTGTFIFRSMDKPSSIIGYESYRAHVDELDTLGTKASDAWRNIIARNRQKNFIGYESNTVCAYTTPEGYCFVYERWVKGENNLYQRVHADSRSNPYLPDSYIDALIATYPEELANAYIKGQFVNLVGGNVYSNYDRDAHRSNEQIIPGDILRIGCDFNVNKQAATVFVTRSGGHEWHAVDELVDMKDTPEMIRIINERYKGHKIIIYPDASGNSRKSVNADSSDIALLHQAGFEVRAKKSKDGRGYVNPAVRDRIVATNVAFSKGRIFINDNKCRRVAECLEQQAYDRNGEPDKTSGTDHQNDATTYPIVYEMAIRKPVARIEFNNII